MCEKDFLTEIAIVAYQLSALISHFVNSWFVDRFGRKRVHIAGNSSFDWIVMNVTFGLLVGSNQNYMKTSLLYLDLCMQLFEPVSFVPNQWKWGMLFFKSPFSERHFFAAGLMLVAVVGSIISVSPNYIMFTVLRAFNGFFTIVSAHQS